MISASVESHGNKIMSETGRAENRCCNCELTYPLRTITVRVDSADPLLESAIEVRLVIILIPCRGDALPRGSDIGDKLTGLEAFMRNVGDGINQIKWKAFFKNSEDRA